MMPRLHPDFLTKPRHIVGLHDVSDGRPENSRAAIHAAIRLGYGVEIDLQLSADKTPIVFHDYGLNRLTAESGPVAQRSAEQLRAVQLSGGDEYIPDLAKILAMVAGKVPLLIEVKDQNGTAMGQNVGPLEQAAADLLFAYNRPVGLMSFNPHSVARLADLFPKLPRGIVTNACRKEDWPLSQAVCDHLREIPGFDRVGTSFISHEMDDLDCARVLELKSAGVNILCWTIKSSLQELHRPVKSRKTLLLNNISLETDVGSHSLKS